jgi:hypothetical protein
MVRVRTRFTHLLKHNAKVNVHQLARYLINENVGAVPIPQAHHVADHGGDGHTAGVREAHAEPCKRLAALFAEKVPHHRLELVHNVAVH